MKIKGTLKRFYTKLSAAAIAVAMSAQSAMAQTTVSGSQLDNKLQQVTNNIGRIVGPIIDIVLAIIGVLAVGIIAWAFAKKKKGDSGANDAIMDAAWTTLAVVAFIYIVRLFFFQ